MLHATGLIRTARSIALALLVTAAIGGCGGADSPSAQPTVRALASASAAEYVAPVVVSIAKVSETRVSRTTYDFVFEVTIKGGSELSPHVLAEVAAVGAGTSVRNGVVRVDGVAANAVVKAGNITLRQDRAQPFNASAVVWRITVTEAPPTAVKLVEVSSLDVGQVTASWLPAVDDKTPADKMRYQVHAGTDPAFIPSATTLKFEGTGVASASMPSGWTPGQRIAVKVVALDEQGQRSTSEALQVIVSDTQATLVAGATSQRLEASDVTRVTDTTVELRAGTSPPAVGQFITSAEGQGMLRKVTAVAGNVVTTGPASLNQVIQTATITSAISLTAVPSVVPLAASTGRRTIAAVESGGRTEVQWPDSRFRMSSDSDVSDARRKALGTTTSAPEGGARRSTLATVGGANIDVSSKRADGGTGRFVTVNAPDTVAIVAGTAGSFDVSTLIDRDDRAWITENPIPLAICKLEMESNPLPGVVSLGAAEDVVRATFNTDNGPYSALRSGNYPIRLNTAGVAARAEPYRIKLRLYVDEAGNRCEDFLGRSLLGWKETIAIEVKLVVTSTPNFPKGETKRLPFSSSASLTVTNDVTFTIDPMLEAEVRLAPGGLQMARLEAKGRIELKQELEISAVAAGQLDKTLNLVGDRRFVKVFMAGPVPIVMSGVFAVDMRIEGSVTGTLEATETLSYSLEDLLYGLRYENGQWTTPANVRPVQRFKIAGEGSATANLTVSLLPKLNVSFYEALTGRLVLSPYLAAEAGVKGKVLVDALVGSVTLDADWWIAKGAVTAGVDAYAMADLRVLDLNVLTWPSGANPDNYKTWLPKITLMEPKAILGIPALAATVDMTAKHPTDSRAILIRGKATDVPNPFGGLPIIAFDNWTKPLVVAANNLGYRLIDAPEGSAKGDHWIVFDRPGTYTVRLGGVSNMGGWARQIAETTINLTDNNANGIVDQWETKYGLVGSGPAIAAGDGDNDGKTNLQEWQAGTDPTKSDVAISIAEVVDDAGPKLGPIPPDGGTDDSSPSLFGVLNKPLEPGEIVRVYDGAVALGVASVSGLTWSFTSAPLTLGTHSFTATIASPAGFNGVSSAAWSIRIRPDLKLPPTGITSAQCYQAGSDVLVSCTSAGAIALSGGDKQDGMRAQPFDYRLVNKAGGGTYDKTECVFDAITGLTWEGKTASGLRAGANTYTNWADGRNGDASAYAAYVNSIALCGRTDWRLPSAVELQGIVNYGVNPSGVLASIDGAWYPNTLRNWYWSSSPYAGDAGYAWYVFSVSGYFSIVKRDSSGVVRLVR